MPPTAQLTLEGAQRLADAHGLGVVQDLQIVRGSVNTNAALRTATGRFFLRIYEVQGAEDVAWEWVVQDHLKALGQPLPGRIRGPAAGALRVHGHPVGMFEAASGVSHRPSQTTPAHLRALGEVLGRMHAATLAPPAEEPLRRRRPLRPAGGHPDRGAAGAGGGSAAAGGHRRGLARPPGRWPAAGGGARRSVP